MMQKVEEVIHTVCGPAKTAREKGKRSADDEKDHERPAGH